MSICIICSHAGVVGEDGGWLVELLRAEGVGFCLINGGGSGSIAGSLIGALIMAVLRNGSSQSGWPNYMQEIIIGIVIIQPIAPMGVYGVISNRAAGHVVTTILIAMVAMLFTAISYGRMARAYPHAGFALRRRFQLEYLRSRGG